MEAADDRRLVLRTGKDGDCSVLDWNHGVVGRARRVVTAGTVDTARRSVMEECRCVVGRESTDGGELFEVVVTANERDCKLIQEEKCHPVTAGSVKSRLTRVTLDGWRILQLVWLVLGGICWWHTTLYTSVLIRQTGK